MSTPRVIAVGVDGSSASEHALRVAARYAAQSASTVRVITTWMATGPYSPEMIGVEPQMTATEAALIQAGAIERAFNGVAVRPEIDGRVVEGASGPALVEASRGADYLVVGSVHKGIIARFTEGSTSTYCTRHSHTPVLVVPFVEDAHRAPLAVPTF